MLYLYKKIFNIIKTGHFFLTVILKIVLKFYKMVINI